MGIRFLYVCLLFTSLAFGADIPKSNSHSLRISDSLSVRWSPAMDLTLGYLPSFHGFWLEGGKKDEPYSVWITKREPAMIANTFSVRRLWKENLKATAGMGEKSNDLGCKRLGTGRFRCDRTTRAKGGRFSAEALVWNAKSDLVVVRAMSAASEAAAKKILSQIDFDLVTRFPAGAAK